MPYDISPFLRAHLLIWPRRPPGMGLQVLGGIRLLCLTGLLAEMALFAFFWSPLVCTNFQLTSASACAYAVMSDSLQPRGLKPTRVLCPWDFPEENTRAGCHSLLQGISLTQGSNPRLLHWHVDSLPRSHQGSPIYAVLSSYTLCDIRRRTHDLHPWC